MDGGLYGAIVTHAAIRPLLLMSSAESNQYSDAVEEWRHLVENANADAYWLELPNSTHFSFTITQLLSPILAPKNFDPRVGLQIIDVYVRAFFDRYLRRVETLPSNPQSYENDVHWLTESRLYPLQK
jgi:hypothetical protein